MKIGVMSDTHLYSVTDELKRIVEGVFSRTDLVLHAGDIVSGEVLVYLESCGVVAVHGNMCRPEVAESLPDKRVVEAAGFRIGLMHGWGARDGLARRLRREFGEIDCLVYGHSHRADNTRVGGELVFNPGTAVMDSFGRNTVGLLTITDSIQGEIIPLD